MALTPTVLARPSTFDPLGAVPLEDEADSGPSPSIGETIGAAFRQENLFGSMVTRNVNGGSIPNTVEEGYNPWTDIVGTPYEDHWNNFVKSNNRNYTAFLKKQIDNESNDRRTLEAAGWTGTLAAMGAGLLDPSVLIPIGGEIKFADGAWTLTKGAVRGARGAAVGTAVQEAGLQAYQELRTKEESAVAIGSSVVLGALIGGSAASLLSRPEQTAAAEAIERLHEQGKVPFEPQPAGAAAVQQVTAEDLTVAGRAAKKLAEVTKFISPNLRANFRAAPSARRITQELSENTLYQNMHAEGRTLGAAVETEARVTFLSRMAEGQEAHNSIFKEMKKAGVNMSADEFETAIGQAMRRGDVGDNDFVSRAAKVWRETVFDPWKNEAIQHGLLPADVTTTTAESYFSRMYNHERLNAQEPQFKERVTGFYEQKIAADYEESAGAFKRLMKRYAAQEADLSLKPAKRAKLLAELEAQGEALDTANAFHVDRLAEVNDLRQQAKKATAEGRHTDADVLKLEARKRFDEGGEPLKQYVQARRELRRRHERLQGPANKAARDVRLRKIAEKRAAAERLFYDRWEIKRLGEGVDPHAEGVRPNFREHASQIADDVFDKITGRNATSGASVDPEYLVALTRGPMKDRTFNVPDALIEDFLEHNVRSVAERYGRTMSADIELTRRFGRADMRDQIEEIRQEYKALREAATSEADRAALVKDEKDAINDLEAVRDLIRGTYKAQANASNYGRVVRSLMAFNYLRSMGGAVIANISELYRPAMVHGLSRFMGEGVAPLLSNMSAVKLSVKEAKLAGQVTERILQHRMMSLGEIGDPYRSGTQVERWLTNGTRRASKWNGLVFWTDGMKAISSVLSQNRIVEAALSKGTKDTRLLAYLGIDGDVAERIAKQLAEHGEDMDGVKVANTQHWTDEQAVRAYRAAVSKDVDSIIVTKSVGDVPLFANTPTGRLILQFRNYTFAAHQRVTLRGLQEGKAQFLSGIVGTTSLGMLAAALRSWRGGEERFEKFKDAASNPGYLIGEGLDMAGTFALPMEIANTTEKVSRSAFGTGVNPLKTPLLAAGTAVDPQASMQGESTRFASRGPAGAILGPTFGLLFESAPNALGASKSLVGREPSESQKNAAIGMIPFGSYPGMREALQLMTDDSPYGGNRDREMGQ